MNKKVGIVCCSNGQKTEYKRDIEKLGVILKKIGVTPIFSKYIYEIDSCFSGNASERAKTLMDFYQDDDITAIYDISGGDIANEILPYLDYDVIKASNKFFWGYSDLTTVINALYAKTGCSSVLYQIKNLVWDKTGKQEELYKKHVNTANEKDKLNKNALFDFEYDFVQGSSMSGIVIGGNIRCFLKLAGTEYFPDVTDKILLLEAMSGETPQMVTYLNQLKQIGVFDKLNGILLGTFIAMEGENCKPDIIELVKRYAGDMLPIAKTPEIGHRSNSKAIFIGEYKCFEKY